MQGSSGEPAGIHTGRDGKTITATDAPPPDGLAGPCLPGPPSRFGPQGLLVDAALEAKVRISGVARFVFTRGRDLRTGRNAFYAMLR